MQDIKVRFFEFGEFRLDARRRILLKNNEPIQVQNRHFELLLVLIENAGQILSQDELIDKVWDGAFIEQSNLKKGISALRHILGESPNDSEFIRTIPRKGYSFVASVRNLTDEEISTTPHPENQDTNAQTAIKNISAKPFFNPKYLFLFILILIIFGVFFSWRFFRPNSATIDFSRMQIEPLTSLGNVGGSKISPNGEYILFGAIEDRLYSVWLKHLPTGKITVLLKPQKARIYSSTFTPDNNSILLWLAFEDDKTKNGIYKIDLTGSEPQKISEKNTGLVFSPDGKRIAYRLQNINEKGESGIFTANPDFSDEKLLFGYNTAESVVQDFKWSPDGRFITYVARTIKNNQRRFFIAQIPAEGGAEQFIVPPRVETIWGLDWFPDGKGMAVMAIDPNTQLQQVWYLSYPAAEWRRITNDLTGYSNAQVTPDGKGIVVPQQRDISGLWVGQSDGQNFRQLTFDTMRYEAECSWFNEEMILFSANSGNNFEIWEMSADGTNRRQLTFEPGNDIAPRATPDGKRILFISNRSGMRQVWQMEADGKNPRQITNSAVEVQDYKILPDGNTIVYEVWLPGQEAVLFKKTIEGGDIKQLPIPLPQHWDISPDGKTVAFAIQTEKGLKVRLTPLEENAPFKEFDFGNFDKLVWTKDGKALLYDSFNKSDRIMLQPIEGGAPRQITNFNTEDNIWNFDLSPSGKQIVARRVRQYFDLMLIKLNPN
ncbi:MAG TPA: winged helix-turn-helix domain-containing protein [Pyrinomonadaceae bacterium]|nr:winged helix-turn-helix domain-containing protein [Pyrinomonadaceae bacterium]